MNTKKLPLIGLYIFYGLLAYMPLHILLSTWIGTSLDTLPFMKIAKDVALVFGFVITLVASVKKPWFSKLANNKLAWLILAYAALTVLLALIKPTDPDAEVLGVVYNTRFLLFFLYGLLLAQLYNPKTILDKAIKIVLGVGAIVIVFGIIQYTLLPDDALTHIGYSRENGVLPAFFIDDKPDLERAMSTLRDPNSLGSYLLILAPLALLSWPFGKSKRFNLAPIIYQLSILACLAFTFSRSAWLGFVLTTATAVLLSDNPIKKFIIKHKKTTLITSVASLVIISSGLFMARNSYFVQNVVFHADESTVLEDPNELRLKFLQESVNNVAENPAGSGPGTAGLASIRNNQQGTILNENYYLQIATEVGVIGLLLFLGTLLFVAKKLLSLRKNLIAVALLASFIGLAFTNLLVHIWSNEAVAYTWWGLAGLVLAVNYPKNKKA